MILILFITVFVIIGLGGLLLALAGSPTIDYNAPFRRKRDEP